MPGTGDMQRLLKPCTHRHDHHNHSEQYHQSSTLYSLLYDALDTRKTDVYAEMLKWLYSFLTEQGHTG